jgi:drug/metabolite transporter (DMT)-like permease
MSAPVNRPIAIGQAVIVVLMVACAAAGPFPSPVPLLFVAAAAGAGNAAFPLMRTFGSALLGGTAAVAIALAAVPFTTCASPHPSPMFVCANDGPSWHLAGAVIAAGLCGAGLVLARVAAQAEQAAQMTAAVDELREEILRMQ